MHSGGREGTPDGDKLPKISTALSAGHAEPLHHRGEPHPRCAPGPNAAETGRGCKQLHVLARQKPSLILLCVLVSSWLRPRSQCRLAEHSAQVHVARFLVKHDERRHIQSPAQPADQYQQQLGQPRLQTHPGAFACQQQCHLSEDMAASAASEGCLNTACKSSTISKWASRTQRQHRPACQGPHTAVTQGHASTVPHLSRAWCPGVQGQLHTVQAHA